MKRWRVPAGGAVVALLLASTYFMAFHRPRSDQIAALATETGRLRSEQTSLRRSIAALEGIAAREPEYKAALDLVERLIPGRLAQPALLAQMQLAAQGAGVELVSVTFGEPAVPKDAPQSTVPGTVLVAMPVTVAVNGPYVGIASMLRRIETEKNRAVLVRTVALTEADAGFPQLTGTWSGQAYALLAANDPLVVDPTGAPRNGTATTTQEPVKP